ncbi:MAG: acyl-CoA dehydratase activase-related protein [Candidatus Fibromonas sp.]|jgi:predicted nucleotide-binding protein (sugar kinase/HSP70/actin superfamily)|nr:acyl-CoA dehydratase activase-related protein [Candidatus Fibromonas sp.]
MAKSTFIGLDAMESFGWEKRPGQVCQFCSNNCSRTIVVFSDGRTHVTGNRCERGEVFASPDNPETKKTLAEISRRMNSVPDMLKRANQLLTGDYSPKINFQLSDLNSQLGKKIGIPRALEFFASLPFWKAFFTSLGFEVVVSRQSDYNLFEEGLRSVPGDTVCFPAKLLHGHVADLVKKKVDRIFLPVMIAIPTDHKNFKATAVCPVVQGYPAVVRNIDDPEKKHGIPVDQPTFHWSNEDLRRSQCIDWFSENWKIPKKIIDAAVSEGETALQKFSDTLQHEGQKILDDVRARGEFVVVVAGRPYHLDPLINHLVANHFTQMGIPVLPLEALPGVFDQEIPSNTRMEALNSFHMRMLGATLMATKDPSLELVQIVSFGCGHDAILSDEIMRILHERSDKELLMLKLDEGDVRGPVSIRIKSFIETVRVRRKHSLIADKPKNLQPLFSVPYVKGDGKKRVVLIPNLSPAFSFLCSKVMEREGFRTELLPLADKKAFELGKKFVHNDICFPAQVNIGEGLRWLEQHPEISQDEVCMGLAKNCENCRAGQYAVMCRKALDEAGYPKVPILTTGSDSKNMHPGFSAGLDFRLHMLWGMAMMDGIEIMLRIIRPYEKNHGEALRTYNYWIKETMQEAAGNIRGALKKFEQAVEAFNGIEADISVRKPRVAVLGEILMKYHPSANGFVEEYLFEHGMEVVQPGMLDFFRVGELVRMEKVKRGFIAHPFVNWLIGGISSKFYSKAANDIEKRFKKFKFYEHHATCYEMADIIEKTGMLDKTYITGEGWLIPGEVLSLAEHGVNSFVIVQPFACLANHISGRGLTKAMKSKSPHIQVLSLDYDPDTSFANIENRLQMLIINAKELEVRHSHTRA